MSASRAVRGEDRDPILGLRTRRILTAARGRRKGPPWAPRHLRRASASPAARAGDATASATVRPEGTAVARGVTDPGVGTRGHVAFTLCAQLVLSRFLAPKDPRPWVAWPFI
ncbi:hypothetical protein NDU88_007855 [Pleurodeles waltl]|uniref:Uncharacterized protein n=1 Tax=Pleurodeles waltl TaxID=8319 RepID=A0AAV7NUC5_PLEWA|nr:hypothetical protein NDU88_007855 [Pleurodeles waltl]